MKVGISLFSSVIALSFSVLAQADFQPFDKAVTCKSANDGSTLKVSYDKTTNLDLGWAGTITVEIGTASNTALAALVQNAELATDGSNQTIRRQEIAGQVGNWIQQDTLNPVISQTTLNFGTWDLLDAKGNVTKQANGFISALTLSKISESGFLEGQSKISSKDSYLVRLVDDFGDIQIPFELSECSTN